MAILIPFILLSCLAIRHFWLKSILMMGHNIITAQVIIRKLLINPIMGGIYENRTANSQFYLAWWKQPDL